MLDRYDDFKKDFFQLSKIDLNLYKENQMRRRIEAYISKCCLESFSDFFELLQKDVAVLDRFLGYLTINVSEFYRNPPQWHTLEEEVIPYLKMTFGKKLRIWSAACSTGDEPYSLAMVFEELIPGGDIQITATDLDKEVLRNAEKGYYSEKSIKGLPARYKEKYIVDEYSGVVRVCDSIRNCITFKEHNLLKDPYPSGFDLIVCRNVLIYFTEEAKNGVYTKFSTSLKKDGILFVGSTEQILNCKRFGFNLFRSFFYQNL